MIKLIIFDFDGTIVDTKAVYYTSINKHLNPLGFNRREIDKAIDLGLNLAETIKKFVPSIIYSWWIKKKIMKDVLVEVNNIKKCRDVGSIKGIKTRKILISNSLSDFVIPILKHLKIKNFFDEIYYAEEFDDKADFIRNYLKKRNINSKHVIYVGDRAADAGVAKEAGCLSVIITGKCAWDGRKELIRAEPDFMINDLAELKEIVNRLR